ncbi:MAG: DUF4384 domain-containing protein [Calditerrivibrio sp.]|nr:DUF4384 domain-containing protein [Calditerrivibrio sp.]
MFALRIFLILLLAFTYAIGSQSKITEAEGYACLNEDRTKKQVEEIALNEAKRNAIEHVATYIQSETEIKNFQLKKDLITAYSKAQINILQLQGRWDNNPPKIGDCYRVWIKADVIPDEKLTKKSLENLDDPSAPLKIQVWTDKKEYITGDKIKIYIKGNKPFYSRILYTQSDGSIVQILPNLHRKDNYFQGGIVYEIPSGSDKFDLEVAPPFGEESITVYASTNPLGEIQLKPAESVYKVLSTSKEINDKTRGVKITEGSKNKVAEFYETTLSIKTGK